MPGLHDQPDSPVDHAHRAWRELWHRTLHARPVPLFIFERDVLPAASLWSGVRRWTAHLRQLDLAAGERVVIAAHPGKAFLMAMIACWWERLTIVLPHRPADAEFDAEFTDASLIIAGPHVGIRRHPACVFADAQGTPADAPVTPRRAHQPPTPRVRLLIQSSGTSGRRKRFVALSDANLLAVASSHRRLMPAAGQTALSVLPWTHAFGLVIDLLPALLDGATIIREPSAGRDPGNILHAMRTHAVTRCCMVPLQAERLLTAPGGADALRALRSGIVGGAPASPELANALTSTNLRAGYGQTEASPGITLGEPGRWHTGAVGSPVNCCVSIDRSGELLVTGPNVCVGDWDIRGFTEQHPARTLRTGDLVRADPDGCLTFLGRIDHRFKLANGRMIDAPAIEADLTEVSAHPAAVLPAPDRAGIVIAVTHPLSANSRAALPAGVRTVIRTLHAALPRTRKGEIDRQALRTQLETPHAHESTDVRIPSAPIPHRPRADHGLAA